MITLYTDKTLKIEIPESHEECCEIQNEHSWCTKNEIMYKYHTIKLKQILFRFIYTDGYIFSLGINPKDFLNGQYIDNVKNNDKYTTIRLSAINGEFFNDLKIKEIAINQNDKNLENLALRISQLSDEIKNIILNYLKN